MISQEQFINSINQQYDSHFYRVKCLIQNYREDKRETAFLRLKMQLDLLEIDKVLFNLTHEFDLQDWNLMRNDKYWETHDQIIGELNKKIFLLDRVKKYIADSKNVKP